MTDNLRVSLWLAERMGLQGEIDGGYLWIKRCPPQWEKWQPHQSDAQLWQVVRWAAMNGLEPDMGHDVVRVWPIGKDYPCTELHDNTPATIDAAVLMAIARATGWDG